MIRNELVEAVLLENVLKARHRHEACAARCQIICNCAEIGRRVRLVLEEVKRGEGVKGSVLKNLILPLRIFLRDREALFARLYHKLVKVLHPVGPDRIFRENREKLALPAAGLQYLLAL